MGERMILFSSSMMRSGTDNADAFAVASQGIKGFLFDLEVKLGGKAYASHHAERIVTKRNVGIEWRGDNAFFQVQQTVKGVNEFT